MIETRELADPEFFSRLEGVELRARSVVDREHGYAHAAERADRRQTVDERGVANHSRWVSARAGVGRDAIAVERRPAAHRADSRRLPVATLGPWLH